MSSKLLPRFFVPVLLTVILCCACNRDHNRPVDLPNLIPCEITVIQDGKPLEEAVVTLRAVTPGVKYATSSAVTDTSGVARLKTYGYSGTPEGEYKITVQKTVTEDAKIVRDAEGTISKSGGKNYSLVDSKYTDIAKTPLEIKIVDKKNAQTLDVGKAVHDFVGFEP